MKKTMLASIQVLSSIDDTGLYELLSFPSSPFVKPNQRVQAVIWANGGSASMTAGVEDICDSITKSKANFVEMSYKPSSPGELDFGMVVTACNCQLRISPTSPLWASTSQVTSKEREPDRPFYELDGFARFLRWQQVAACPHLWHVEMRFETRLSLPDMRRGFARALRHCFESVRVSQPFHGFVDFHPSKSPAFVFTVFDSMQREWPGAIPELDSKYDALHPILFGAKDDGGILEQGLGDHGVVDKFTYFDTDINGFVAVLEDEAIQDRAVLSKTAQIFVSRNSATAIKRPAPDPKLGEYELETRQILYSIKRRRELEEADIIPTSDDNYVHMAVIPEKYCRLLGIEPDDMIGCFKDRTIATSYPDEFEAAWEKQDATLPLKERVVATYDELFKAFRWRSLKVPFQLVKKYFLEM